ncbi:nuclear transport factor 2 family protein [Nocardia sp. NPDC052316]|uniref:nuclear transport factor 2 family protein n=1 Tax=Nocardia sp. NPDC052316 TaxID=3364329 RepID=UPI0037C9D96D
MTETIEDAERTDHGDGSAVPRTGAPMGWASAAGVVALPPATVGEPREALDRLMIADRIARYGWAFDEGDREALADCLTSDVTYQSVYAGQFHGRTELPASEGVGAFMDTVTTVWSAFSSQPRHIFTNVVVGDLGDDRATAYAYMPSISADDAAPRLAYCEFMRFEFRRTSDGLWRISSLTYGMDVDALLLPPGVDL